MRRAPGNAFKCQRARDMFGLEMSTQHPQGRIGTTHAYNCKHTLVLQLRFILQCGDMVSVPGNLPNILRRMQHPEDMESMYSSKPVRGVSLLSP